MIRNIIFDFGGVILNIDNQLSINCFKLLGIKNYESFISKAKQEKLFVNHEKGLLSDEEFREKVRELAGNNLSDLKIDHAWNAMLLNLPQERLDLLYKVKNRYRTFLLSNTNSIHYDSYMTYLNRSYNIDSFADIFEKDYLSFKIGKCKPDPEAFMHIIKDKGINPEETLFIDDTSQHVEGAKKTGFNAYWLDVNKESILDLFDENGVLIM
jgi:glucose-1-phosphatase